MAGNAIGRDLFATVERTVQGLGYQLVDVERLGGGLLRVTLDSASGIGVEDCERVSRQLSHVFTVEDMDYERLEVSSPGLDRRLNSADDFAQFVGREINVHLYAPLAAAGGRKRLRGRLLEVVGGAGSERVRLELLTDEAAEKGTAKRGRLAAKVSKHVDTAPAAMVEIALTDIDKARLIPELNFRPARLRDAAKRDSGKLVSSGSLGSEH